jgi:hypothetical protein
VLLVVMVALRGVVLEQQNFLVDEVVLEEIIVLDEVVLVDRLLVLLQTEHPVRQHGQL